MPVPVPPQAQPAEACPLCGSPLASEQEWCLRCGAAARTRLASTPKWRTPLIVLGLTIVLALGVLTAALAKLAGGPPTTAATTVTITRTAGATTPGATTTTPGATIPGATTPPGTTTTPGATTTGAATSTATTVAPGALPSATIPGATAPASTRTTPRGGSVLTTPSGRTITTPPGVTIPSILLPHRRTP